MAREGVLLQHMLWVDVRCASMCLLRVLLPPMLDKLVVDGLQLLHGFRSGTLLPTGKRVCAHGRVADERFAESYTHNEVAAISVFGT